MKKSPTSAPRQPRLTSLLQWTLLASAYIGAARPCYAYPSEEAYYVILGVPVVIILLVVAGAAMFRKPRDDDDDD